MVMMRFLLKIRFKDFGTAFSEYSVGLDDLRDARKELGDEIDNVVLNTTSLVLKTTNLNVTVDLSTKFLVAELTEDEAADFNQLFKTTRLADLDASDEDFSAFINKRFYSLLSTADNKTAQATYILNINKLLGKLNNPNPGGGNPNG